MGNENDSILISIKKLLGITESYNAFDQDIIIHINSVLAILNQLGVGPKDGFLLMDDKQVWNDYITGEKLSMVKSYIYLKVRLMFDPPSSGFLIESINRTISELEWRLSITSDNTNIH